MPIGTHLLATHELAFVGASTVVTTGVATASTTLVATPVGESQTFLVYCTQDVHLRQGTAGVTAATTDFFLKAETYLKITVTTASNNVLAYIRDSANGSLYMTIISDDTP